ncbi:MAG: TetR/AcrR family transcriptional regulator [Myxococcales bacterium]|nr:TetR/AcrR family transcriptional regulator [Myxococcales bacterium]
MAEQEPGKPSATSRTPDKRERILEAAIAVFAEKGFAQTKVSEIAKVAGVADGTIYLYFENKDDLLIKAYEASMDRILESLARLLAETESTAEKVERFIQHHLQMVGNDKQLAKVITVELRTSPKFMVEYKNTKFNDYLRLLSDIIANGQGEGVLRGDIDPALAARALFGMLDELSLMFVLGGRMDLRITARLLYETFMNGTAVPQSGDSATQRAIALTNRINR